MVLTFLCDERCDIRDELSYLSRREWKASHGPSHTLLGCTILGLDSSSIARPLIGVVLSMEFSQSCCPKRGIASSNRELFTRMSHSTGLSSTASISSIGMNVAL